MLDKETIANLIKTFHLAITNLRIYPPTSQMVTAIFDTFYKMISAILETDKSLTFSELSGKMLVNGKEPDSREIAIIGSNILRVLNQRKIQSITFGSGLTKNELSDFVVNLLTKKRDDFSTYQHIALDQTVYVAMVKGEEAIIKITELVGKSGGEIVGLIKSVRESYDIIDQIPDQNQRIIAQNKLAQELAKQDTATLREIFERELPSRIEESGLKTQLLGTLSQDKIREIFGDIAVWYEEIRKKESSDFAAIEQLEKLQKFIKIVLQSPAAKDIPRQFFENLIQKGLLEQLPDWFSTTPSKPTTVYEIERLIEKNPVELIDNQILDSIPQMVEKLCQIEETELLGKLVEKLTENLKNSAAKIRLLAIQSISTIYGILQAHSKENLLRYMELPVLESAKQETSSEVHFYMLEILRQRIRQDLLHGEYDLALRILDLVERHSSAEIMPDDKIRSNSLASKQRLIPEIIEILVSDMKSNDEKKRLGSLQIFAKLGDNANEPLIRVIKESDDIRPRRLAVQALKNIGENAIRRFREELNLSLTSEEIIRVVEALSELGGTDSIEELNVLLQYPDAEVKKHIMHFLAKLNTSQSRILLIEQLKSSEPAVLTEAIRLSGELRLAESVPTLLKILSSLNSPPNLQEEICIVLGKIGDLRAAPALISKLTKKTIFFRKNRSEMERVRMRAAWSLRKFRGQEVEQALERSAGDKVTPVALTARESLAVIRQQTMANETKKTKF